MQLVKEKKLTVSQLTGLIKNQLEVNFDNVKVEGEISNYKPHYSGHRYFNLKDENSIIACVMWKSRSVNFNLEDGLKVTLSGGITVYPPRGGYQLDVSSISTIGLGDLYLTFEQMKAKLEAKGYFAEERKRELPLLPKSIGIATSETGAVIQDMLETIRNRFPSLKVYFRATQVQGEGASNDIVNAIKDLQSTDAEVLIVGRGGGSIEDLWAFNTEIVADAIFNSKIPIISAVGHQTDFTIADFVADKRAPTPTAAAQLVTNITSIHLDSQLIEIANNMHSNLNKSIKNKLQNLNQFAERIREKKVIEAINYKNFDIDDLETKLSKVIDKILNDTKTKIDNLGRVLNSLNPFTPLDKGFALLSNNGKYLNNKESIVNITELEIVRKFEIAKVKVLNVKEINNEK